MRSLKALLAVAIFGSLIYGAYLIVPVYLSSYQFQDAIEEEARLDTYSQKTEQDIRDIVFKKAQSLNLPLTAEQIKVLKVSNAVTISAAYTVHIDVPVHPFDLSFTPNSQNHSAY
jgi:Domain of unknown function (DUF4845)